MYIRRVVTTSRLKAPRHQLYMITSKRSLTTVNVLTRPLTLPLTRSLTLPLTGSLTLPLTLHLTCTLQTLGCPRTDHDLCSN